MGSSFSKSKHSFFKPIKDRQIKDVASRDLPLKPRAAKATNFFAQKETPSIAKRNRRRNNKNVSVNMKNKKKKKISKSLIGKPTNFQHTTHIGAGEVRSGQLDAEQFKSQMLDIAAAINSTEEGHSLTGGQTNGFADDAMKNFQLADQNWDKLIDKAKNQPSLRKQQQANRQRGLMEASHKKHREMAKASLKARNQKLQHQAEPHSRRPANEPRFTTADYIVPAGMAIPRKPASMEQKIAIVPKKMDDIVWNPSKLDQSQDFHASVSSSGSSYISLPPTPISMIDSVEILETSGHDVHSMNSSMKEFELTSTSTVNIWAQDSKIRRQSYAAEKYTRRQSSSAYTPMHADSDLHRPERYRHAHMLSSRSVTANNPNKVCI